MSDQKIAACSDDVERFCSRSDCPAPTAQCADDPGQGYLHCRKFDNGRWLASPMSSGHFTTVDEPVLSCPLHVCDADSRACNRDSYHPTLCGPMVERFQGVEVRPVGTAARIAALEAENARLRADSESFHRELESQSID